MLFEADCGVALDTMSENITYALLIKHPFIKKLFAVSMNVHKEVFDKHSLKLKKEYTREPTENEFYCLELSRTVAHLLTVLQQLEHTPLYMSNFCPTDSMRKANIDRSSHLLWSVENYIIRTHTMYERLLIVIDRLFHIQNQANRISHESIVTNTHISLTRIPRRLKHVKSAISKFYRDRNKIIHEEAYEDDDLRHIEALALLVSAECDDEEYRATLKEDMKRSVSNFTRNKKNEFLKTNELIMTAMHELFGEMTLVFDKQYKKLNRT